MRSYDLYHNQSVETVVFIVNNETHLQ